LSLVPASPKLLAESAQQKKADSPAESKANTISYTVKSGDRLIFIAKKFKVQPEELIAYNKISDPTKLQIGQTLNIPRK
jgi:LysM repeat protein